MEEMRRQAIVRRRGLLQFVHAQNELLEEIKNNDSITFEEFLRVFIKTTEHQKTGLRQIIQDIEKKYGLESSTSDRYERRRRKRKKQRQLQRSLKKKARSNAKTELKQIINNTTK